jgi:hypothetical protein
VLTIVSGDGFKNYFTGIGFDYSKLAGAKVVKIEGQKPYDYIDLVAKTVSGNYLDHGVRVNSVFSSYRISSNAYSQRFGDLAGPTAVDKAGITFQLIPVNSTKVETVFVPYTASFVGSSFTDKNSYWANNCAATNETNGQDYKDSAAKAKAAGSGKSFAKQPMGYIIDATPGQAVGLPPQYQPSLPTVGGAAGVIRSYILPGNTTGVIFVGSFGGDYTGFQTDIVSAISAFKAAGVTKLLIGMKRFVTSLYIILIDYPQIPLIMVAVTSALVSSCISISRVARSATQVSCRRCAPTRSRKRS